MRPILIALLLAGAGGCAPNFHSVRATASLGARVGGFADALDYLPRRCASLGALAKECAPLGRDGASWHRPPSVLADYAAGLARLAGGKGMDIDDRVGQAAFSGAVLSGHPIDDKAQDAIGLAVQSLVGLIAHAWKARELSKVIADAAPHVAAVTAALDGEIALQRKIYAALDAWLGTIDQFTADVDARVAARSKELSPAAREQVELASQTGLGTRAAISFVRVDLRDQDARLARYSKAVRCFAEAHRQLAAAGHLDDDKGDDTLLKAILETARNIAEATNKTESVEESNGNGR